MDNRKSELKGELGAVPCCRSCKSERVVTDAWACWNPEFGLWELETAFDRAYCKACEAETTLIWHRQELPPNQRIRELNDRFRRDGEGQGTILLTDGIQERGGAFAVASISAVRAFDDFTDDNDPWGEHDLGAVEVAGEWVFFKIDYYNPTLDAGSENPANEGLTHRVLTIMLPSEF